MYRHGDPLAALDSAHLAYAAPEWASLPGPLCRRATAASEFTCLRERALVAHGHSLAIFCVCARAHGRTHGRAAGLLPDWQSSVALWSDKLVTPFSMHSGLPINLSYLSYVHTYYLCTYISYMYLGIGFMTYSFWLGFLGVLVAFTFIFKICFLSCYFWQLVMD